MTDEYYKGEDQRPATWDSMESVLARDKLPWRPKAAGRAALFLRPLASALVAAAGLPRIEPEHKAQRTLLCTLALSIAFLIPFHLGIPADAPLKRIILLAVEGAGYSVFPSILREDCGKWKTTRPGLKPRSD